MIADKGEPAKPPRLSWPHSGPGVVAERGTGAIPLPDNRIRKQIEDILERDERRTGRRRSAGGLRATRLTPERLMLAGLAALLIALIVRSLFVPLALAALILFGLGYALRVRGGRARRGAPKRPLRPAWRGQPAVREGNIIEFRESWLNRLRRWLRGR